jgi:hypothetical protein
MKILLSGRVGSFQILGHIESGGVSDHLVSGHFGFQVILGRVSSHLVSGHFGFRVVSGWAESNIGSSSIGIFRL